MCAASLLPVFGVALNGTSSVVYGTVADFVAPQRQARIFALFYTIVLGSSGIATVGFGTLGDFAGIPTAFYLMIALLLLALGRYKIRHGTGHRGGHRPAGGAAP